MQVHIIGDLHGYYDVYESLLIEHGIIDASLNWTANSDQLWLIGDILDRGGDAESCIALTMKLQQQASAAGGLAQCLLGNHELMFLAAKHFMGTPEIGEQVWNQWVKWGGQPHEMGNINDTQMAWLSSLPAMAQVGDLLLVHSDNLSYVSFGRSIDEVNRYFADLKDSTSVDKWNSTLRELSTRGAFNLSISGPRQAALMLKMYGGKTLVHGHTPISLSTDIRAEDVTQARTYANGICCNVDAGIYLGSPGFIKTFEMAI